MDRIVFMRNALQDQTLDCIKADSAYSYKSAKLIDRKSVLRLQCCLKVCGFQSHR